MPFDTFALRNNEDQVEGAIINFFLQSRHNWHYNNKPPFDNTFGTLKIDDSLENVFPDLRTGGSPNFGKWSFPEIDALLDEQDRVLDVLKGRDLLLEMQRLAHTLHDSDPRFYILSPVAHLPEVKHVPVPLFSLGPHGVYQHEQEWIDPR